MFRRGGLSPSARRYRMVAGYLAFVGGYVNSAGLVLVGTFTSHTTGNVGRFASEVSLRRFSAAAGVLALVVAFWGGAFLASMIVESDFFGKRARSYGVAVSVETLALALCGGLFDLDAGAHRQIETLLLCGAMGMQNSLITRLSGAVVRTTHLTGVITDMGIEAARWLRWWRWTYARHLRVRLAFGRTAPPRPVASKGALLVTIACAFATGALAGSVSAAGVPRIAMLLPVVALMAAAAYAFTAAGEDRGGSLPPSSRQ